MTADFGSVPLDEMGPVTMRMNPCTGQMLVAWAQVGEVATLRYQVFGGDGVLAQTLGQGISGVTVAVDRSSFVLAYAKPSAIVISDISGPEPPVTVELETSSAPAQVALAIAPQGERLVAWLEGKVGLSNGLGYGATTVRSRVMAANGQWGPIHEVSELDEVSGRLYHSLRVVRHDGAWLLAAGSATVGSTPTHSTELLAFDGSEVVAREETFLFRTPSALLASDAGPVLFATNDTGKAVSATIGPDLSLTNHTPFGSSTVFGGAAVDQDDTPYMVKLGALSDASWTSPKLVPLGGFAKDLAISPVAHDRVHGLDIVGGSYGVCLRTRPDDWNRAIRCLVAPL